MVWRRLILGGTLCLSLLAATFLAVDRWVERAGIPPLTLETSVSVVDRNGHLLRAYTVADGRWRLPVTRADVDPRYLSHLIAYEDKRFYRHGGVDIRAFLRAAVQAVWNGRIVSGGSTLTMQVARLLEESGTGRWGPKLRQIQLALALERRLGKGEILDLYLKLAPFGGNLEGVRAATLSYFGKEPRRLTAAQAALLVALPQSPETRRPDRSARGVERARDRVLDRLVRTGALPADEALAAKSEPVPDARKPFPALAPHIADRARARDRLSGYHALTLERDLQMALETLALRRARDQGAGLSVAIVVMDHQSGEVLASVGSAGFTDQERQGFVDMTEAIRSPGSTLKPLIYGLAYEAGLVHPETLVEDRPTAFGAYAPQNFDKQYYGTVTTREALQHSLNVPAVLLMQAVGPAQLMARMQRAGVKAHLPGNSPPGLAIALGGIGLSLNDLMMLYAGIARGGQPVERKVLQGNTPDAVSLKRLMSPEAAWQVGDILTGVSGPDLAPDNDLAYKTGTSYGYRDAWAIGFDGAHVIGVWMGRPDGASVPGILGARHAAPILFEAFGRLKTELAPLAPPPPATLIVSNSDLPQPLKRFRGVNAAFEPQNPPEIAFPPDGAKVELEKGADGKAWPLVLKVRNGTPPFTWIADGVPVLVASHERQVQWAPPGAGFLMLSVIDANGLSEQSRIEVK